MAEEQSAEKDLLKLIENPGLVEAKKKEISEAKLAHAAPGGKSAGNSPLGFFSHFGKQSAQKGGAGAGMPLSVRQIVIRTLLAATAILSVYFIATFYQEYSRLKHAKRPESVIVVAAASKEKTALKPPAVPAKHAAESSTDKDGELRNIFKPAAEKKEEPKKTGAAAVIQQYKLVGISIDANSNESYAMVENIKTSITLFLKKGEKLEGMELVKILDEKLVFKADGQEIDLR